MTKPWDFSGLADDEPLLLNGCDWAYLQDKVDADFLKSGGDLRSDGLIDHAPPTRIFENEYASEPPGAAALHRKLDEILRMLEQQRADAIMAEYRKLTGGDR